MTRLRIRITDGRGGYADFEVVIDDQGELRHSLNSSPLTARKLLTLHPSEWLDSMGGDLGCKVEVVE